MVSVRSKSSNLGSQPLTPGRIERSLILAKNRRLDVTQQPDIAPLIPSIDQPNITLKETPKTTTSPIVIEEVFYDEEQLFPETLT